MMLTKPQIAQMDALEVSRDISGGVKIRLGNQGFILSPQDAVTFAAGIFKAAGCKVDFNGQEHSLIRAPGVGLAS